MPHFYFHLAGTRAAKDSEGTTFLSVEEAIEHATVVAHDLAKNRRAEVITQDRQVVEPVEQGHDQPRLCLDALVKQFGTRRWQSISAREAKAWIRQRTSRPSAATSGRRSARFCSARAPSYIVLRARARPSARPPSLHASSSLSLRAHARSPRRRPKTAFASCRSCSTRFSSRSSPPIFSGAPIW